MKHPKKGVAFKAWASQFWGDAAPFLPRSESRQGTASTAREEGGGGGDVSVAHRW